MLILTLILSSPYPANWVDEWPAPPRWMRIFLDRTEKIIIITLTINTTDIKTKNNINMNTNSNSNSNTNIDTDTGTNTFPGPFPKARYGIKVQ